MIGVAVGGGSFAALGVDALDGSGPGEDAVALVADHMDKEPGNRIGIGGRGVGDGFAVDAACITSHPRGSGEMLAECIAVGVEEVGVGSLQNPGKLRTIRFTGVNLITLGVEGEEELFAGGRL